MADKKKTHEERKDPQISINRLADYMAASEQVKRRIIASCKYRPIAPVIQHADARQMVADYLCTGGNDTTQLKAALELLETRLCDNDFEETTKRHNCDYVRRFIIVSGPLKLPKADCTRTESLPKIVLNGTRVSFYPQARLWRVTRRNVRKTGTLILRYAKGQPLRDEAGRYESAFMFGYLAKQAGDGEAAPDKALCVTLDCYAGVLYQAPGDATYRFKEMAAVCTGIAERWPAIKPPRGAVL